MEQPSIKEFESLEDKIKKVSILKKIYKKIKSYKN